MPEVLKPEEACTIVVTWQPTTKGLAQGVLMVQHSGKAGMAQAELKGFCSRRRRRRRGRRARWSCLPSAGLRDVAGGMALKAVGGVEQPYDGGD